MPTCPPQSLRIAGSRCTLVNRLHTFFSFCHFDRQKFMPHFFLHLPWLMVRGLDGKCSGLYTWNHAYFRRKSLCLIPIFTKMSRHKESCPFHICKTISFMTIFPRVACIEIMQLIYEIFLKKATKLKYKPMKMKHNSLVFSCWLLHILIFKNHGGILLLSWYVWIPVRKLSIVLLTLTYS